MQTESTLEQLIEKIENILSSAYFEYEKDDRRNIYITEGSSFPGWVTFTRDRKFIKMWTYLPFRDGESVNIEKANELVNKINEDYIPNSVHQAKGRLYSSYVMYCDGDFNERHLVAMLRRVFESFRSAVFEHDKDDLIA